ncbi:MAG TPA: alpha/beta hydrolase [Jiangellaceae bacterium]|nr:alpha/beta hydrolase [Jiangellaceae bacterium]
MAGRVQVAISTDGTEIVGRVQGHGPSLVLVHGALGDGEVAYVTLVPHLADRFTCYTPSTRGRGLSGDNPDHSPPRLQEDVTAFVGSIGEPVCLVGWSGSGAWVLGAAAHSDSVAAVTIYEPVVIGVGGEGDIARLGAAMQQVGAAAADGRILDAVRAFLPGLCTDNEIAALEETPFCEQWTAGIPALLRFLQQDMSYQGPRSTDPEALRQVAAPVLLLRGEQTLLGTFFADVERHLAQHVVDAHVRELPGVGHFAPLLEPELIAKELISFFESTPYLTHIVAGGPSATTTHAAANFP